MSNAEDELINEQNLPGEEDLLNNDELLWKRELNELVKKIIEIHKKKGIKLTKEKIAINVNYGRTYFSNLLKKHGKVTVDQVAKVFYFYRQELKEEEDSVKDAMVIKLIKKLTQAQKEELLNEAFHDPEEKLEFQRFLNEAEINNIE